MNSNINGMCLLKEKKAQNYSVIWFKNADEHYGVEVVLKNQTGETKKYWSFEQGGVKQAFSYFWFHFVTKSISKHKTLKDSLLEMDSEEVNKMLARRMKNL